MPPLPYSSISRCARLERLRVSVENGLTEETNFHWHGMRVPNALDGVPQLMRVPIGSDGNLAADNPAEWMFHCHILEHQPPRMAGVLRVS